MQFATLRRMHVGILMELIPHFTRLFSFSSGFSGIEPSSHQNGCSSYNYGRHGEGWSCTQNSKVYRYRMWKRLMPEKKPHDATGPGNDVLGFGWMCSRGMNKNV